MTDSLIRRMAEACSKKLLEEKWILCSDRRIAQGFKDRINFEGTPTINLHGKSINSVAWELAKYKLDSCQLVSLQGDTPKFLMHDLLSKALHRKQLNYFSRVQHIESVARTIWRSIHDLRLDGVPPDRLLEIDFESQSKAGDLKTLYDDYVRALTDKNLVDYAACLELVATGLNAGDLQLPQGLTVLIPSELRLTKKESQLLESISQRATILDFSSSPFSTQAVRERIRIASDCGIAKFDYFSGNGESNEVREVLRRVLHDSEEAPTRLDDIEVVLSDLTSYGPLIYEILSEIIARQSTTSHEDLPLPVTLAEGIPCVYTRPGRALRAWLRWVRTDGLQAKAVQMLREGILNRPQGNEFGYIRLASNLRRLPLGFGLDRYLPTIQVAIETAKSRQNEHSVGQKNADPGEPISDYGNEVLYALKEIFESIIDVSPKSNDTSRDILGKAKRFLLQSARADSRIDRIAKSKLLDEIDGKLASLIFADESPESLLAWMEELPVESCILQSGAMPGCLHVTSLKNGGFTGRKRVFFVGLDTERFPKLKSPDPILLDSERTKLSTSLVTSEQLTQFEQEQLYRAIERNLETNDIQIQLSFCARDLVEGRELAPSPEFIEIFRLTQKAPRANVNDVNAYIGKPSGFVSDSGHRWLDGSEEILAYLLSEPLAENRQKSLESIHPQFADLRAANEHRASPEFTHFDGWVPEASEALSPNNTEIPVSANRLESFGTCPRRYFFKYGLGVVPPDNWEVDPEKWLDSLQRGSLLHSVFEKFLRQLTMEDKIPNFDRDFPTLLTIADSEIENYKSIWPIRSQGVFETERKLIVETCETFLREDEDYCIKNNARPWVLEASIGLEDQLGSSIDSLEPVKLVLNNGRLIPITGRIDRVDRYQDSGSECFAIWDYKTGSAFEYSQSDPFHQGRKLQSFLYVGMLRHRLSATRQEKDSPISFGYFFPGPKTNGLRLQWSHSQLKEGDSILSNICDLIEAGSFPATTNQNDCTFCDYLGVCKSPPTVASESVRMSVQTSNEDKLFPWKKLRMLDEEAT